MFSYSECSIKECKFLKRQAPSYVCLRVKGNYRHDKYCRTVKNGNSEFKTNYFFIEDGRQIVYPGRCRVSKMPTSIPSAYTRF